MTRLGAFLAACALTLTALVGVSQLALADDRADKLFEQAGQAMFADPPQYEKAIDLYKQAIVLSPEARFYFNLCIAYYSIGEFGVALQSCDAVDELNPDSALVTKNDKLTKQVEDQIRAMGKDPEVLRHGEGTGDGSGTGTGTGGGGGDLEGSGTGTGNPVEPVEPVDTNEFKGVAPPNLFQAIPASHDYVWSAGGELYGLGGNFSRNGTYGGGGAGFRLHADYIIHKPRKIGLQGYVGFNSIGEGDGFSNQDSLSVVEFGLAAYSHVWCQGALCVTPLAGVEIAGFQPTMIEDNQVRFVALGLRGEVGISYALGSGYEHVISFNPGLNFFLPTGGDYEGAPPSDYDLEGSHAAVYFGFGYTHRFNTPFGQAPFVTLE
jgi:hypothetical protein